MATHQDCPIARLATRACPLDVEAVLFPKGVRIAKVLRNTRVDGQELQLSQMLLQPFKEASCSTMTPSFGFYMYLKD